MNDIGAGTDFEIDRSRLPWLELEEEEDVRRGRSMKAITSILIGLVIFGFAVGGAYWLGTRAQAPQLIASATRDSQTKPAEPNRLKVDADEETALAANDLDEPPVAINPEPAPQTSLTSQDVASEAAPAPIQKATRKSAPTYRKAVRRAVPHRAVRRPTRQGTYARAAVLTRPNVSQTALDRTIAAQRPRSTSQARKSIQLGAYSSPEMAQWQWQLMSWRFGYLRPLAPNITPVSVNGRKYYRLRATGRNAKLLCSWLRADRQTCVSVS
jgi:hypothetical protein